MKGINIREFQRQNERPSAASVALGISRLLTTDIRLFPSKLSDKSKEAFYLELSTLLTAGLDIKSALELIEEEQTKKSHAEIIRRLKDDLVNGDSLWEAMQKSGHFTPYEYYSIQIGEETGKMSTVMDQLYQFYLSKLKQRRQFVGALSYPIIILVTSVGAVSFMLLFIVPMFNDVFKRFGGNLPYLTQLIIGFSHTLQANFLWGLIVVVGVSAYVFANRKAEWLRKFTAKALYRVPVVGRIVYSIHLARFCSSMSLLLGSKVPMMRSIALINQMITFYPIHVTLKGLGDDVLNGESLHTSMSKYSVYDRRMISLIKVGEAVNRLDIFFDKLAKQYSSDAEHQTSVLNTFLEPAMIIFLGLAVGFILLAMYLPMFELSTNIG